VTPSLLRAGLAALALSMLAGCIDSSGAILTDSKDVFGAKARFQLYTLRDGRAREPLRAQFKWNGARYEHAGGDMDDVAGFTVHPFEAGDYIIQEVSRKRPRITEYALAREIADGVYLVWAIDEMDADERTRAAFCGKGNAGNPTACRIASREQLFAFARATAARRRSDGGLVLRLPDGRERRGGSSRREPPARTP
jgi:hypothetical protein